MALVFADASEFVADVTGGEPFGEAGAERVGAVGQVTDRVAPGGRNPRDLN